ncbi:MAG: YraN family protein [Bryobacter sp.]|nr:YraN family protein [Bryobacter sp.]
MRAWWLWTFFDWLRHQERQRRVRQGTLRPEHAVGQQGEDLAHRYLQSQGYTVIERNWRSFSGLQEVDLVALDGGQIVFVEVKTRRHARDAAPERNIDTVKLAALRYCALQLEHYPKVDPRAIRCDFVGVVLEPKLQIEHQVDALNLWPRR